MPLNCGLSSARRNPLLALLRKKKLDAILLFDLKNIRYLLGFSGSDGAALIRAQQDTLLIDGRYATQARQEAAQAEVREYSDKIEGISDLFKANGVEKIGIEAGAVSLDLFRKLKKRNSKVSFWSLSAEELGYLRAIKELDEIERIKRAIAIGTESFFKVTDLIKPGISERDIATELEYQMRKAGAEGISFSTIVASGPNSALPHGRAGARKLERGDVVIIDWGAAFAGYHSDETCTLVVGKATADFKKVYNLVREAHDRAIAAIRPGVSCAEVDRQARECIEQGGWGPHFTHGTGHGIGLDIHESPRLTARSVEKLEAGMVVTVEPGVYIPGLWGVRIEDVVEVTDKGAQILTHISKELWQL